MLLGVFAGIMHIIEHPSPSDEISVCWSQQTYKHHGDLLREVADVKTICGHLRDPQQLGACKGFPYIAPGMAWVEDRAAYCRMLQQANTGFEQWLEALGPDLIHACWSDEYCLEWAAQTKGWDGKPILE